MGIHYRNLGALIGNDPIGPAHFHRLLERDNRKVALSDPLYQELSLELSRREIHTCGDIEILRDVCLQMLNLVEGQRAVVAQMVKQFGV